MIKIDYGNKPPTSEKRKQFNELTENHTDNDFLREILYSQIDNAEKLEAIRSNTSKLVWFLIAIPIIIYLIIFFSGYSFLQSF